MNYTKPEDKNYILTEESIGQPVVFFTKISQAIAYAQKKGYEIIRMDKSDDVTFYTVCR